MASDNREPQQMPGDSGRGVIEMNKFYYGSPKNLVADVADSVGTEWSIDDIAAVAKMIRCHDSGPYYVADDQPVIDAIREAIETSISHGSDAEPLSESASLEDAISALAAAVTSDSRDAGHSVASQYVTALAETGYIAV